jgi:hypothetical protein
MHPEYAVLAALDPVPVDAPQRGNVVIAALVEEDLEFSAPLDARIRITFT